MIASENKTKTKGGKRANSGRKSRKELGLEPLIRFSSNVEGSVIEKCRDIHGSVANALRFAAKAAK